MTPWTLPAARRLTAADLGVASIVFVLAWAIAVSYLPAFRSAGGVQQFYQEEYGPAVMLACGRGFVSPDLRAAPPALAAFLDRRVDRLDCEAMPAVVATTPLNALQGVTRYTLLAAAAVWGVRGVAWPALDWLLAGMYAVAIASAYLALRFVSGRLVSIVGTVLWAVSPMHLQNLPNVRDYSKAPFFVLTIVAMALVIMERKTGRLAMVGGAFGLAQGIGLGMRSDVVLNFVPFLAAVFLAGPRKLGEQLKGRLACAGAAIAVFGLVSLPILRTYSASEGFWHVSLLGLTTPFDRALSVRPAPYDLGYVYQDSYVASVVQAHWSRRHPDYRKADLGNVPDGPASREYYAALAATFPGDLVTRMVGSAMGVLNLPFSISYGYYPLGVSSPLLVRLETWRARMMLQLIGVGPLAAAVLLVGIGMTGLRNGGIAFAVLLYWAAYPSVQFQGRHVFALEFLIIAIFVWLIALAWRTVRSKPLTLPPAGLAWRSAALVACLCAAVVAGVAVARRVQAPRVRALLASYEQASTEAVPTTPTRLGDGQVRLLASVFDQPGQPPGARYAMLVVDFPDRPDRRCAASAVDITFRYRRDGIPSEFDFSRTVTVPAAGSGGEAARVYFPAYGLGEGDPPAAGFIGIDLPAARADCVRVARIREPRALPLLLNATLVPGWAGEPLSQRLDLGPLVPERFWIRFARWWPGLTALG